MTRTTDTEHAVYASGGDVVRRFLSVGGRAEVFTDQITALITDADSGGVVALDHAVSWAGASVQPGQTVDIGTTPGARDVGSVRLRYYNSTNTRATIAETAAADVPIEVGHYFSVRLEYLPWQIPKRIVLTRDGGGNITAVTEYFDYDLGYPGGADALNPKPNITAGVNADGSPKEVARAGWVDGYGTPSQQTYRTLTLSAQHSVMQNFGATKTLQVWTWTGSATIIGVNTDETIQLQVGVGFHYIGLFVQDSTGATADIHWMGVWVHDDSYPPLVDFNVTSDETETGREMQAEFFGNANEADETVIPKTAHVCYWEDAEFVSGAPGEGYRSQCIGWVTDDEPLLKLGNSRYGIRFGATATWKQKFRANSVTLIDTEATPTTYTEMAHMTVDRVIDFSLRAVDTLRNLINVYYSGVTAEVERMTLPLGNAWTQIADSAPKASMAQALCDSLGNLWLRIPLSYIPDAGRVTRLVALDVTGADWTDERGLALPTGYVKPVGTVNAAGELWDGGDRVLYGSVAPSSTEGSGVGSQKMPDQFLQLPSPTDDLNRLSGFHYAHENNPRPNVSLLLAGNLDVVEPAWGEPVALTWVEDTIRGTVLNSALFLVKRVSTAHSNEPDARTPPKQVTWTLEQVTTGAAGKTVPQLQMPDVVPPDETACAVIADFTSSVDGATATFTNTSSGDLPYAYYWDFGDGSYSNEPSPVHIYATNGDFTVTLVVISECGDIDVVSHDVTVDAIPCTVKEFEVSDEGFFTVLSNDATPGFGTYVLGSGWVAQFTGGVYEARIKKNVAAVSLTRVVVTYETHHTSLYNYELRVYFFLGGFGDDTVQGHSESLHPAGTYIETFTATYDHRTLDNLHILLDVSVGGGRIISVELFAEDCI